MKKIYLVILSVLTIHSFSQKDYARYYNSWRLGLNGGVSWQTADVRSCWGMAGGITLEKGFHENATNFFSFAIRGRYLGANTYGMDTRRNYNVKTNDAYNGTYDPIVNYQADTATKARGYVYDNYKMTLGEGSLELQITFNRLREKTHVLLNLWGGVGFTSYRTNSDLLDANGSRYNFSNIDSLGSQSTVLNSYNSLIDKKYESYAQGSKNGNLITFSPSGGIGLGYQFSPGFSMLWEYKITLPQGANADLLDGKISTNNDFIGGNKDYYHYTGINFLFTLRGKTKTTTPHDENSYTSATPINTVTNAVVTNTVVTTNTVAYTPPTPTVIAEQKPIITYITPSSIGQITNKPEYKISAQILNVTNANQIKFYFNSILITNFNFNSQSHTLEYFSNLSLGTNYIQIIATNTAGSDQKSTSIIYEKLPEQPSGNPPSIQINNPGNCPFNTQNKQYNVIASSKYITSRNNITIKINNEAITNFNFNTTNGQISFPLNLINGNNNIFISVINNYGSDVASCNIVYTPPIVQNIPLPIITFINPPQSNFVSSNQNYIITAQILNVTSQNNISVYYNGMSTAFSYNNTSKQITFTANLNEGSNSISISAFNSAGEDNKTTSVIYNKPIVVGVPPIVNLISPTQSNNTSLNSIYNFKLSVINVNSKNDITVMFNGLTTSNFTYNTVTKEVDFSSNLITGNNTLIVKGTNSFGSDYKTINVNYQPRIEKLPPHITFINPTSSPFSVPGSTFMYKANITNVKYTSNIVVKFNGLVVTNYTYNGMDLTYNALLNTGDNILEINAANSDGNDVSTSIVNYTPRINTSPPIVSLVNPSSAMNTTDIISSNFKLSVVNVNSQNDIEVNFNGNIQSNFTYNTSTKIVEFSSNLLVGNNTLIVKGTNQFGVDYKTVTVTYTPHVDIKLPPIITFIHPSFSPLAYANSNYIYKATIGNMPNNSGITVTYNGNQISNYNYDGFNLNFNATLNSGANTLEINAINNDGTDFKSATVSYKPKPIPKPPIVNILSPINTPTVSIAPYSFSFSALNVTQSQISVSLNGNQISIFSFMGSIGTFTNKLEKGMNTLIVSANNIDGTVTKTESVYYNAVEAISSNTVNNDGNSIETSSITTTEGKFVSICHFPGNNQPSQTLTINMNDWPSHQAHGDTYGACPVNSATLTTTEKQMVICHIVTPNTKETQTMTIPISAWSIHQAHGDEQGSCAGEKGTTGGEHNINNTPRAITPGKNITETNDTLQKNNTVPINTPRRPR